jgi:hypothetical protein
VGLPIAQLTQGQHPARAALLQQHRGATTAIHQAGEQAAIAAEGRLLAGFGCQPGRSCGLAP